MTIYDLRLVDPEFGSELTNTIMKLDHLRKRELSGSTAPWYFFQLKQIFHSMESLGSARIEGNRTTIADYVEHQIDGTDSGSENIREIENITRAMEYVEKQINSGSEITHRFIRELHAIIVNGLSVGQGHEGDATPGAYRAVNVTIAGADHVPPEHVSVQPLMDDLLEFIKHNDSDQYDLIKVALVHHRFTYVHPFANGNGRVVRMLNYALLIKYGFNVQEGRILNPSCVFFSNRDFYYECLAIADGGTSKDLLFWCHYVLAGILDEIVKIDDLLSYDYLSKNILVPAIEHAVDRKVVTKEEADILKLGVTSEEKQWFKAGDIGGGLTRRQRTHAVQRLKELGYIVPLKKNARSYCVNFSRSHLLRGVIKSLEANDFIPPIDAPKIDA